MGLSFGTYSFCKWHLTVAKNGTYQNCVPNKSFVTAIWQRVYCSTINPGMVKYIKCQHMNTRQMTPERQVSAEVMVMLLHNRMGVNHESS